MVDRTLARRGIMALEGPEVMGALTRYPTGNVDFPMRMMELGVPEDIVQGFRQSGFYIEPPTAPNLTESQVRDLVRSGVSGRMPGELGQLITQRRRAEEAARLGSMPAEADIFELSGPERGTELSGILAQISGGGRPGGVGRPGVGGGFAPPAPPAPEKPPAQLTREPAPFSTEDAFKGAMDAYTEASGQEVQPDKTAEDYMKEFAEITGIDISGKPDKSAALMAFGLALMQNRAGSGFNVGNILRSVGEAGEKALPELQEAKKEAKAARMAAGKYAMEQIAAGRSARAALAAEQREFAREAFLKQMELDAAAAKTVGQTEIKNVATIPVVQNLDIRRGTYDGRSIFVDGSATANALSRGYNATTKALQTLTELENAINEIGTSSSPTLTLVVDRMNSALAGAGLKDPNVSFGEEGLSPEEKANALKDSILQEFKRFLTQETGNGISNVDIERAEAQLGKINLFQNPQQSIFRIRETRGIFQEKLNAISPYIEMAINDPGQYASEQEYNRAMEIFNKRLGETSPYNVTITEGVPTVDVTGG